MYYFDRNKVKNNISEKLFESSYRFTSFVTNPFVDVLGEYVSYSSREFIRINEDIFNDSYHPYISDLTPAKIHKSISAIYIPIKEYSFNSNRYNTVPKKKEELRDKYQTAIDSYSNRTDLNNIMRGTVCEYYFNAVSKYNYDKLWSCTENTDLEIFNKVIKGLMKSIPIKY